MDNLKRIGTDDNTNHGYQRPTKNTAKANTDDHNMLNFTEARDKTEPDEAQRTSTENDTGRQFCSQADKDRNKRKRSEPEKLTGARQEMSSTEAKRIKTASQSDNSTEKPNRNDPPKQNAPNEQSGGLSPIEKLCWTEVAQTADCSKDSGGLAPYLSTAIVKTAPNFKKKDIEGSIVNKEASIIENSIVDKVANTLENSIVDEEASILVVNGKTRTFQRIRYSKDLDANLLRALNGKSAKLVTRDEVEEMRGKEIHMVPATDARKNSLLDGSKYFVAYDENVSLYVRGMFGSWKSIEDVMDR